MKTVKFTGLGSEYFKIWSVNVLLTILTLGLYYPWAKVRTQRYFNGNTVLDDARFEYHATGRQLFPSYIVSVLVLIVYMLYNHFYPAVSFVVFGLLSLVLPWLLWKSLQFNFKMTSYRNVRFGFVGSLTESYTIYFWIPFLIFAVAVGGAIFVPVLGGIVAVILFMVFFPISTVLVHNYLLNNLVFGQKEFNADIEYTPVIKVFIKAQALGLMMVVLFSLITLVFGLGIDKVDVSSLLNQSQVIDDEFLMSMLSTWQIVIIGMMFGYLVITSYVTSYIEVNNRRYIASKAALSETILFESSMQTKTLLWIKVTNLIMLVVTVGLAYPWTRVRLTRYRVESMTVKADDFDGFVSQASHQSPLGQELGDAFDADTGAIGF